MRTLQQHQQIQQSLIDKVKAMELNHVLEIINETGMTLITTVNYYTASYLLGKEADSSILQFCLAHPELNLNLNHYAAGVGASGNTNQAEMLINQYGDSAVWVACGAAEGGFKFYANQLRYNHDLDVSMIARASARGGDHTSAECLLRQGACFAQIGRGAAEGDFLTSVNELRTKLLYYCRGDNSSREVIAFDEYVALGIGQGGSTESAEKFISKHAATVNDVARGAARGGNLIFAEKLRTQYGANVDDIAKGAARGGYRAYAEKLRTQYDADVDAIAYGAAEGGHLNYAEELITTHHVDISTFAFFAAKGGCFVYTEKLITRYGANVVIDITQGAARGRYRQYAEEIRRRYGVLVKKIVKYATGNYREFLQKLVDESHVSTHALGSENASSDRSEVQVSAASPTMQKSDPGGEIGADYPGLIVIHLPTHPDLLRQFESQLNESYKCPITREVFTQPVVAADGYTYEYTAIKKHIDVQIKQHIKPTSPLTNRPLENLNLVPNNMCARSINEQLDVFKVSEENDETRKQRVQR